MMQTQPWLVYALLAAVAAALTNVFGRVGVREIDSTFATTVRSMVMMAFMVAACTRLGRWQHWRGLHATAVVMIVLSGVAGATSWLFGFKALSMAEGAVYRVGSVDKLSVPLAVILAVIFLKERPLPLNWAGIVLIVAGAYLVAYKPSSPTPAHAGTAPSTGAAAGSLQAGGPDAGRMPPNAANEG